MDGRYQGRQAKFAQNNVSPLNNRLTSYFRNDECALTDEKDARSPRGQHNTVGSCLALTILVYISRSFQTLGQRTKTAT